MKKAVPVLLLIILAAGCTTDPLQEAGSDVRPISVRAALGDTVRLSPGEVAAVGEAPLRIGFVRVATDSRCPTGVDCVWSGDATARLELSLAGAALQESDLHTHHGPSTVAYGSYEIELVRLEPHPREGETIRPADYVALLVVRD